MRTVPGQLYGIGSSLSRFAHFAELLRVNNSLSDNCGQDQSIQDNRQDNLKDKSATPQSFSFSNSWHGFAYMFFGVILALGVVLSFVVGFVVIFYHVPAAIGIWGCGVVLLFLCIQTISRGLLIFGI